MAHATEVINLIIESTARRSRNQNKGQNYHHEAHKSEINAEERKARK